MVSKDYFNPRNWLFQAKWLISLCLTLEQFFPPNPEFILLIILGTQRLGERLGL
jgi:hypothetical protein